jgi:hypothetical protein
MAKLLAHDGAKWPVEAPAGQDKEAKKRAKKARKEAAAHAGALESFDDEDLNRARALVAAELQHDRAAAAAQEAFAAARPADVAALWADVPGHFAYLPERHAVASLATASASERLSALTHLFEACRGHMAGHADKCAKLEKKLAVRVAGYEEKAAALRDECAAAHARLDQRALERQCFDALAVQEARAAPQRVADLYDWDRTEAARNEAMQREYKQLLGERDRLTQSFVRAAAAAEA